MIEERMWQTFECSEGCCLSSWSLNLMVLWWSGGIVEWWDSGMVE